MGINKATSHSGRKKFDVDLEFGQEWERHVDELFSGAKTVEIKTERDKWATTGNICIEIESYGKPSGLAATEADLWVHNLVKDGELVCSLMFTTKKLREIIAEMKPYTVMGGYNNASKLCLVSIKKLMDKVVSS